VSNYTGTSGGIGAEVALCIFQGSDGTTGVKYVHYLGDGMLKGTREQYQLSHVVRGLKLKSVMCIKEWAPD
jgi:hypothetical protein